MFLAREGPGGYASVNGELEGDSGVTSYTEVNRGWALGDSAGLTAACTK